MKWAIRERELRLTLYKGRGEGKEKKTNVLSSLNTFFNIEFNTTEALTGALSELNMTITGLDKSKMLFLATATSPWTGDIVYNRLVLEAGYKDDLTLIFDGEIVEATPDLSSPDYKITIKGIPYYTMLHNRIMTINYGERTPVDQILRYIAKKIGFCFINNLDANDKVYIDNYSVNDKSAFTHLRTIAQMTGLYIYASRNRVYMTRVGKPLKKIRPLRIDERNMIASPNPTRVGANVDLILTPSITSGQRVEIRSTKFPQLNSNKYIVTTVSHSGSTRGNQWKTSIYLEREEIWSAREI